MDHTHEHPDAAARTLGQTAVADSQKRMFRLAALLSVVGVFGTATLTAPAAYLADALVDGPIRYLVMVVIMAVLLVPVMFGSTGLANRSQRELHQRMAELEDELTDALHRAEEEARVRELQVRRQDFEARVGNALEMADRESEVLEVVERAFHTTIPDSPAELLLADNSHAHMTRMAGSSPFGDGAMCSVESPNRCPAARRGQVQRFDDSESIDACPKLRDHPHGPCSAVCVPVSVMGRSVGVIHTTAEPKAAMDEVVMADLASLAKLTGARLGLLRVVAETQVQATTDSLTGLLNRRAFENTARRQHQPGEDVAVVMADLDHFKAVNDTYGHDTGDRALRTFAQVLRASVRRDDIVARHGGEEFSVLLPGCTAGQARVVLETVRDELPRALQAAGLPSISASFGVVDREPDEDLAAALARADVALFQAKHEGRDRIVQHDRSGTAVPAAEAAPAPAPPTSAPAAPVSIRP